MAVQVLETLEITSLDDLLDRLGGISPERVRLRPAPGDATEDDFLALGKDEQKMCELVDGVVVEKPMGLYQSILAGVLVQLLRNFLDIHPLGIVTGEEGPIRVASGVRKPDVSFVSWDRLPGGEIPAEKVLPFVPDLAVEIISEGNTKGEMDRKLREYFAGGARLVWYLYPVTRTVQVYTDPDRAVTLSETDTLDGADVLPGFRLLVREWFERAGKRRGR